MVDIRLEATVNGRKVSRDAKPHQRLLDFIRDDLNLTGNKEGCGAGECGTCSVFVDGVLMKSCLLPVAKAQGARIDTIESLAKTGELSVLQKAFHKAGASQCGYCIPGMVMAATAALRINPFADREEIKERLGGNICRCTGYQKIFDAVELARDVQNGRLPAAALLETETPEGDVIGKNVRRIDAPSKVSGKLKYAGDMTMPGMLHVQVLRSPHAHARIVSIDTTAAEAMDGVEGVITSADVPGQDGFGVFVNDQPIMACGKVRYVGEAVAAVAAEDVLTAKRALAAIKVVYEQLPPVFDPDEAMRPGAPVVHDYAPDNITKHIPIRVGDVEQGFAQSDLVVEESYSTQAIEHAYLEPEAGLSYVDHDGVVVVVSPSQNITHHRHMLARIIAKPISKVRFIMSPASRRRFRRQRGHDLPGHAGVAGDEDAAPGASGIHARRIDHFDGQAPPVAYHSAHGPDARWPHPRAGNARDLRRRRLWPVDRGCHAQGGDPGGRALRHCQRQDRHLRHLHQQHAVGRFPLVRCVADGLRHRIPPRYLRRATRPRSVRNPPHQRHARRRDYAYQGQARFGQPDEGARRG
jgi:aerobic-type carbon monoxide dehydrogenase small subunit (CoxS/CutS family)